MRCFPRLCLLAVIIVAAASPAFAQATIHGDLTKDWAGQKALLVALANAMPEDKYGFKPTPAQRSFGQHVLHIAEVNAMLTKALGLEMDLTARGMGVRSQRYSMFVDDGVVKSINVEAPGKFEVSDADTLLRQARELG